MTAINVITEVLTSTREVNGGELEPVTDIYTAEGVATLIRNALVAAGHLPELPELDDADSFQVDIADRYDGTRTVTAWRTPVPGLIVHRRIALTGPDESTWTVTHEASGLAVALYCESPAQAIALAESLGPITDWTRPADTIKKLGISGAVRDVCRSAGVV